MIWQQQEMSDGRTLEGYAKELEQLAASIEAKMVQLLGRLEGSDAVKEPAEYRQGMIAARGLVSTLRHPKASQALREVPDWQLHLHRTEKRLREFDSRLKQRLEVK